MVIKLFSLLSTVVVACAAFVCNGRSSPLFTSFLSLASTPSDDKSDMTEKTKSSKHLGHLHTTEYPNDNFDHILGINDPDHALSQLQAISKMRIDDTVRNKIPLDVDGCGIDRLFYVSTDDLYEEIIEFDDEFGKPLNLREKIKAAYPNMALAAEFKRASPSKGDINVNLDAVEQCLQYAEVGASVISVLTEKLHFKGDMMDMKKVRIAVQKKYGATLRPAILRKDFIFDKYQILEARAHGADTVLLIVAVLGVNQLHDLINFSRKMGMEPLVEVNTAREMEIALDNGARVIGVNNRNLHTFQLDMDTTARAIEVVKNRGLKWFPATATTATAVSTDNDASTNAGHRWDVGTVAAATATFEEGNNDDKDDNDDAICIAALSGISCQEDVQNFRELGVSCCLIGETLMKASDPKETVQALLRPSNSQHMQQQPPQPQQQQQPHHQLHQQGDVTDVSIDAKTDQQSPRIMMVKTCGMTRCEDVQQALQSGANLIGIIFAKSPRTVPSIETAKDIAAVVRSYGERNGPSQRLQSEVEQLRSAVSSNTNANTNSNNNSSSSSSGLSVSEWYQQGGKCLQKITVRQPLLVGVFQDQSADEVNEIAAAVGLDLVQLHGEESAEYISKILLPVIKVVHVDIDITADIHSDTSTAAATTAAATTAAGAAATTAAGAAATTAATTTAAATTATGAGSSSKTSTADRVRDCLLEKARIYSHSAIALLLDSRAPGSKGGGAGKHFDWSLASILQEEGIPIIFAGGLHPNNVNVLVSTISSNSWSKDNIMGVDVSSGIEKQNQPGVKDHDKLRQFLQSARPVVRQQ